LFFMFSSCHQIFYYDRSVVRRGEDEKIIKSTRGGPILGPGDRAFEKTKIIFYYPNGKVKTKSVRIDLLEKNIRDRRVCVRTIRRREKIKEYDEKGRKVEKKTE
jgi:hypothetical protein